MIDEYKADPLQEHYQAAENLREITKRKALNMTSREILKGVVDWC